MARWLAYHDKDQQLWLYDTKTKQPKRIAQSMVGDFADLTWSPDSQWLAYVEAATNTFAQIKVLNVKTGAIQAITSDRYNSVNPTWSSDGKWLYFLSDRMLKTTVRIAVGYAPAGPELRSLHENLRTWRSLPACARRLPRWTNCIPIASLKKERRQDKGRSQIRGKADDAKADAKKEERKSDKTRGEAREESPTDGEY